MSPCMSYMCLCIVSVNLTPPLPPSQEYWALLLILCCYGALYRQNKAHAALQRISDYKAKEKAKAEVYMLAINAMVKLLE